MTSHFEESISHATQDACNNADDDSSADVEENTFRHIVYFTTVSGTSLDIGVKELADNGKLPAISEATLGRVKVTKKNERYYIALPVKERLSVCTQLEILDEALHSLFDAALELQLETIAISRSPVGDVPWANTEVLLVEVKNRRTKLYRELPKLSNEEACETKDASVHDNHRHIGRSVRQNFDEYLSPLLITAVGNSYILTIQDLLTKYSLAIPLSHAFSSKIADTFIKQFICRFGSPKGILIEQGTNFLSKLMKAVAKKFKIHQYQASAYHLQFNGSIERSHHLLTEFLKHFISDNYDWDNWLEIAIVQH
ncbi:uncharacterized protein V1478_002757 [Vespula squamosa]|uniref:Integrase catalytic domain-containing protein n=1 Tax=Vespula squamosa TaxID=30214 RepID=A0ABD2BSJ2_VESSQ